jgi:hypothetical protein
MGMNGFHRYEYSDVLFRNQNHGGWIQVFGWSLNSELVSNLNCDTYHIVRHIDLLFWTGVNV